MAPRVTIGIPFFNSAGTLKDAVRSVFAQSFSDWELILIDDGSTDGSFDEVAGIDDPRMRVIRDGRNAKLPTRLNQIARQASGQYLARMDADDLMHPQRLAKQVAYLDAHPHCDVVGSARYAMDAAGTVVGIERYPTGAITPRRLLSHAILCHPSVIGRTEWFRKNPYAESLPRAEDHELWVRSYGTSVISNMNEPLVFFREIGTVTASKYRASARDTREIIRRYGPRYLGRWTLVSMLAASHGKEWVYQALDLAHLTDLAVRQRSTRLAATEAREAQAIVERVKNTPIPCRRGGS